MIDDIRRLVVTNAQVVGEATAVTVYFRHRELGEIAVDQSTYSENTAQLGLSARVVAIDWQRDLALLQLRRLPEGIRAINLSSKATTRGDEIAAVINKPESSILWTIASHHVRAVRHAQIQTPKGRHEFYAIETESLISPGTSGCPFVNQRGELIGISTSVSSSGMKQGTIIAASEIRELLQNRWHAPPVRLTRLLDEAGLSYESDPSGVISAVMPLGDQSRQRVLLTTETTRMDRRSVRRIWASVGAISSESGASMLIKLLSENSNSLTTRWSIVTGPDESSELVREAVLSTEATPQAIRDHCQEIANRVASVRAELKQLKQPQTPTDVLTDWLVPNSDNKSVTAPQFAR